MSTKSLAIRGVFFNWIGRVCAFAIAFFLTPFLVHTLGDARYGIWSIVMSLVSYYALADVGLRAAGTKYIAQYHAVNDRESINKVMATSFAVYGWLALLVLVIVLAVAVIFPFVFDVGEWSVMALRLVVILTGGTVCVRLLGQVFGATLTALHRFDLSNGLAILAHLIQAGGVVLVLVNGGGLVGMAAVTLGVAAGSQLAQFGLAAWLLRGVTLSRKYFDRSTLRTVFGFGSLTFVISLGRRIVDRSGAVLVGIILGPAAVTYYAIPETLMRHARSIGQGITKVIFPAVSQLDAQGRGDTVVEVVSLAARVMLGMSIVLAGGAIIMGRSLIDLWIGPSYSGRAYPVLCALAIGLTAYMSSTPLRVALQGIARLSILAKIVAGEIVLTVLLGITFVLAWDIVGMALAVLITEITVSMVVLPVCTCRALHHSVRGYLTSVTLRALAAALPCIAVTLVLAYWLPPARLLALVGEVALVGMLCAVSIFLVCLPQERRNDVIRAFWPTWNKRRRQVPSVSSQRPCSTEARG